jgi:hypothetical protein
MRGPLGASIAACAFFTGCVVPEPCGWDEILAVGAAYDVALVEKYTAESTTALYRREQDLTHPAPTCDGLEDVGVGDTWTIRVLEPSSSSQRCSFYAGEVVSPAVDLGTPFGVSLNGQAQNQISVSGQWDYGEGCRGIWEFSVHAPGTDPFRTPTPGTIPAVLVYRVFEATVEEGAACSEMLRREPSPDGFRCGDAFVARMALSPTP